MALFQLTAVQYQRLYSTVVIEAPDLETALRYREMVADTMMDDEDTEWEVDTNYHEDGDHEVRALKEEVPMREVHWFLLPTANPRAPEILPMLESSWNVPDTPLPETRLMVSVGVDAALTSEQIEHCVRRHRNYDWGAVQPERGTTQDAAVRQSTKSLELRSVYTLGQYEVLVVTEPGWAQTVVSLVLEACA